MHLSMLSRWGRPGIGGGFDSSHRPVVGTFDRFNGLSSNILLTFSCYFDIVIGALIQYSRVFQVVSRGRILSHDTTDDFDGMFKSWSIHVTPEMSPSARLIAYYIDKNEIGRAHV